ncbi:hypothetical protein GJV85_07300 [Sulfurimonas aquatica]|uniref:Uncharacterized protein n=1 Tax=Sulfurimonas aquatica TaxID=2672570 RepID=A0A975GD27_9BACT|nr:hypothetical protein [Sulfurimonas aquatica]QSZ41918.1 hypothetical protein GJV85_07300 [Sulfurimonas aquatica]
MEQFNVAQAIEEFMHPTVYTGVKPIFIVAEALPTELSVGQVVEAVWISVNSNKEFSYISKFAVSGKITLGKYYKQDEMEPFHGRVALINNENLENVALHRNSIKQIEELENKRFKLLGEINKEFDNLLNLHLQNEELYLFEKKDAKWLDLDLQDKELNLFESKNVKWDEELFSDLDINTPYRVISVQKISTELHLSLENLKTGKIKEYSNPDKFYGYFIGSQADIAGLKLKSQSYLASIVSLQNDARALMKKIQWLDLDDLQVKEITQNLPKYPFEDYFLYVKKENVRKLDVSDELVKTLKEIILKHMPENDTPLGMVYIPIDKLIYLFHMIISRDEALSALEMCDIVYEPPGVLLGYSGERKTPPKYLVPIAHVAYAYKSLPSFMSVCRSFKDENK